MPMMPTPVTPFAADSIESAIAIILAFPGTPFGDNCVSVGSSYPPAAHAMTPLTATRCTVPFAGGAGTQAHNGSIGGPPRRTGFFEGLDVTFFRFALAAIVCAPVGCQSGLPPPVAPIPVRDVDLCTVYRDDPRRAALAYDGQPVRILIQLVVVIDQHTLGMPIVAGYPPCIILRFSGPAPQAKSPLWVVGVCRGRTVDGIDRLLPGCDFHVTVEGCAVSGPP